MQPQHAAPDGRLPRARLADEPERLPGAERRTTRPTPPAPTTSRAAGAAHGEVLDESRADLRASAPSAAATVVDRAHRLDVPADRAARRSGTPTRWSGWPTSRSGGCSRPRRSRPRAGTADGTRSRAAGRASTAATRGSASAAARRRVRSTATTRAAHACTGGAGRSKMSSTLPTSAVRPAYITCTRSAIRAMTPRSWVMNTTAVLRALLDRLQTARGSAPGWSRRARSSARRR